MGKVFLDLRSGHPVSLLQQSSASVTRFVLGVSGGQSFDFTPLDKHGVQPGGPSVSCFSHYNFLAFFFKDLFVYFYLWLQWVFSAAPGLSLVASSEGCSQLRCMGFSLRRLLLFPSTGSRCEGSVVVAHGLVVLDKWDLSRLDINWCPLHCKADS